MCKLALTPRSYPPKFGLKLVEIFYDLISDKAGMPSLPERLPPAEVSFAALDFSDVWPKPKWWMCVIIWGEVKTWLSLHRFGIYSQRNFDRFP